MSERIGIGIDINLGDAATVLDAMERKLGMVIDRSRGMEHALGLATMKLREQGEQARALSLALGEASQGAARFWESAERAENLVHGLESRFESLERVGGDAGEVFGSLARSISAIGQGDIIGLLTNLHRGAGALAQMSTEADRQEAALEHLGDAYALVTAATNDTMDETDAFRLQQRLLEAGLQLTGEQLATVAGYAREHARALGMDATQATEALTSALIAGSERGLRPFGIHVDSNATRADNLRTSLSRMATGLHDSGVSGRTAAEDLARFDRELGDTTNALGRSIAQTLNLSGALRGLTEIVRHFGGETEDAETANARSNEALEEGLQIRQRYAAAAIAARARGIDLSRAENLTLAERAQLTAVLNDRTLNRGVRRGESENTGVQMLLGSMRELHTAQAQRLRDEQAIAENQRAALANGTGTTAAPGMPPAAAHHGGAANDNARRERQAEIDSAHAQLQLMDELNQTSINNRHAARQQDLADEKQTELAYEAIKRREETATAAANERIIAAEKQRLNRAEDLRVQDRNAMRAGWAETLELEKSSSARMAEFTTSMYHAMAAAAQQHITALIEGTETGAEALRGFAHQVSMALGFEAGERMVMEIAAGLAMIARGAAAEGADPGADTSATAHFASAGMYAVLAGAGFGVAMATNAPKPAGVGSGSVPSPVSRAGMAANDNGGGSVTYVNNFNGAIYDRNGMRAVVREANEMNADRGTQSAQERRVANGRR